MPDRPPLETGSRLGKLDPRQTWKSKLICLWCCMGSTRACVPWDVEVWPLFRLCLSSIKDFLWVLRTQMYRELCVHLWWDHPYGEWSLQSDLLLREAVSFTVYYLVCWCLRKWLKKNCHWAFVESGSSWNALSTSLTISYSFFKTWFWPNFRHTEKL